MGEAERLGDIIKRSRLLVGRRGKTSLDYLKNSWEEIVGERLASHSRPSRLSRKTLTVVADGPAWACEFSAYAQNIRASINALLGKGVVERIRVLSGKIDKKEGI